MVVVTAVVGGGLGKIVDILLEDLIDSDARFSLNLLLRSLLMFLAHVHDSSRGRTVELVTVHALEVLRNLVRHATVLALSSQAGLLVRIGIVQLVVEGLIRGFRD